ncbi:ISAzo13-like element transposase-related protein [Paracraurococcus lichenis]|uniref:ISAzo13-like element transposase-related protein n=1 Tax=Paracraurococcus lichenis TaxID=3064888 RepID=UPI00351D3BC4
MIAGTTTATGLTVTACLKRADNEQGEVVSDAEMQRLLLTKHADCPQWNYTLSPRPEAEHMAK